MSSKSNEIPKSREIPVTWGLTDSSTTQEAIDNSDTALEFQSIHDGFRPRILRYLTQMVGEGDAEDLTQMVMVKVSKGLRKFRGDAALSTWIYRIATNAALDFLRSPAVKRTKQQFSFTETQKEDEVDPAELAIPLDKQTPSIEAAVVRKEMNKCIDEFIGRLPETEKTVLVLSELEGFKNGEIARILGVSLAAVKIRLHRARARLRKELGSGCTFYRDKRNEFVCDRKS